MNVYLYQTIIAWPVLLVQVFLFTLIILALFNKGKALFVHLRKYGMYYGVTLGIAAIAGSLGFSLGYAYPPCDLCWYQRIFHYPQLVIFAVGIYLKDKHAWTYSFILALIGWLIAAYQVLIQFNPKLAESSVCSIVPAAESCSDILIQVFGYLTIPVMSLTFFTALIALFIIQKKKRA